MSFISRVRLPAEAIASPSRTSTAPTGTSPRAPASFASCSARSMKLAVSRVILA
jgi:hypothetical protein